MNLSQAVRNGSGVLRSPKPYTVSPDARGEPGEVAVAGDDAEAVEAPGVEQVHCVDDHRRVGGVLAHGIAELLDRLDRVAQQHLFPAVEVGLGPVAVDALDVRGAVLRD